MFKQPIKIRYSMYSSIWILFILLLFAGIFCPNFVSGFNVMFMLKQVSYITLMAYGATFIIMLGHINVAYGAVMALVGCVAVKIMLATDSFTITIIVTLLLGSLIGLITGTIITKFEIPSFIITLIIGMIARGAAMVYANSAPILQIGKLRLIGQGVFFNIPISIYIMVVCFFITWIIINKTCFGRQVIAVGENTKAASSAGIRVKNVIIKSYIIDGIFTAIAAIVFMARMNSGLPDAGESSEFDVITAVVIGGTSLTGGVGNVTGTFIGAIIVGIINTIMNLWSLNYNWQSIIKGIIILFVILIDFGLKLNNTRD